MKELNNKRQKLFILFLGLFIICTILFIEDGPLNSDRVLYYSYLRSLFFDKDLLFVNEFERMADPSYLCYTTDSGYIGNVVTIGSALLWLPFFLLGHLFTLACNLFGNNFTVDGYSKIYILMIKIGTLFYGFICLWLGFLICKEHFKKKISFLSALSILFLTPFFWYLFKEPTYPHVNSAFTVALFLFFWYKTKNERTYSQWALLGVLCAVSIMVKLENMVILVIPFIETVVKIYNKNKIVILKKVIFVLALLFTLAPQMIVWIILKDNPFNMPGNENLLLPPGETSLKLLNPSLLQTLFSSYHGLLVWSPIFFLIITGFFLLFKKERVMAVSFLSVFILAVYMNSAIIDWWAGVSFGANRFVDISPIFIIPLAAVLKRIGKDYIFPLLLLFFLWSFFLFIRASFYLDLWLFVSYKDIFRGIAWSIKNLSVVLSANHIFFRTPLGLLVKLLLPALVILCAAYISIRRILVSRRLRSFLNYRNILIISLFCSLLLIIFLIHAGKVGERSRVIHAGSLKKYSDKRYYSKVKFMFAPTYLENASYLFGMGRPKEALEEYRKAKTIYPENASIIKFFEKKYEDIID